MKRGTRLTRKQKITIELSGLNPDNWLVERDTPSELVLIHRNTFATRKILKGA